MAYRFALDRSSKAIQREKFSANNVGKAGCPNERKTNLGSSLAPVVHSNELEMDYTSKNKTKQTSES